MIQDEKKQTTVKAQESVVEQNNKAVVAKHKLKKGLVSIVAPAFNAEKYIGEFISNILAQTYDNWELIIVDDGSSDATVQVVCDYAKKDGRIKCYERDRLPKGSVTCRNIGQVKAEGEYIIHFDSDDMVADYSLEQRVSFMETHPEVDYATFRGKTVQQHEDGSTTPTERKWGEKPDGDLLDCFLSTNYPFSVWNNIYRTHLFQHVYWDEDVKIYTDFSYIVPIIIEGYKHAFDTNSRPDYFYRVGQAGAMTKAFISEDRFKSTLYLFEKTMDSISGMKSSKQHKKAFLKFFLLQYERVLINGSEEQINKFVEFYCKYVDSWSVGRIKIVKSIVGGGENLPRNSRKVRLLLGVMFNPKSIWHWLTSRK